MARRLDETFSLGLRLPARPRSLSCIERESEVPVAHPFRPVDDTDPDTDPILILSPGSKSKHICVTPHTSFLLHPPNTWVCAFNGKSFKDWVEWHQPPHWPNEPECLRTCWICTGLKGITVRRRLDGQPVDLASEKPKWADKWYRSFVSSRELRDHIREEHPECCIRCQEKIVDTGLMEGNETTAIGHGGPWYRDDLQKYKRANYAVDADGSVNASVLELSTLRAEDSDLENEPAGQKVRIGRKPSHRCGSCDFAAPSRWALRKHRRNSHGIRISKSEDGNANDIPGNSLARPVKNTEPHLGKRETYSMGFSARFTQDPRCQNMQSTASVYNQQPYYNSMHQGYPAHYLPQYVYPQHSLHGYVYSHPGAYTNPYRPHYPFYNSQPAHYMAPNSYYSYHHYGFPVRPTFHPQHFGPGYGNTGARNPVTFNPSHHYTQTQPYGIHGPPNFVNLRISYQQPVEQSHPAVDHRRQEQGHTDEQPGDLGRDYKNVISQLTGAFEHVGITNERSGGGASEI